MSAQGSSAPQVCRGFGRAASRALGMGRQGRRSMTARTTWGCQVCRLALMMPRPFPASKAARAAMVANECNDNAMRCPSTQWAEAQAGPNHLVNTTYTIGCPESGKACVSEQHPAFPQALYIFWRQEPGGLFFHAYLSSRRQFFLGTHTFHRQS